MRSDRTRQLKTYGKRTASTECLEPPPKKRRGNDDIARPTPPVLGTESDLSTRDTTANPPRSPSPLPPSAHNVKKGTITSYFKVVPLSSSALDLSSSSSCTDPAYSPPSSPPSLCAKKRKPRRLTTRVVSCEEDEIDNKGSPTSGDGADVSRCPATEHTRTALAPADPSTLNQRGQGKRRSDSLGGDPDLAQPLGRGSGTGVSGKLDTSSNKKSKNARISTATVQTTLSLSLNDTGFTECKECGMLYNPVHAKDVKLHARQHAAAMRRRTRSAATDTACED